MANRRPPRAFCRECGKDLGRRWQGAPLCEDCAPPRLRGAPIDDRCFGCGHTGPDVLLGCCDECAKAL